MNRKLLPTLFVAASLAFTACATPSVNPATTGAKGGTTSPGTANTAAGTVTLQEFESFKTAKEGEITALKEQLDALKKSTGKTPDNSALAFKQRPAGMLYFPVLTLTADDPTPYAAGYVAIEPQAAVKDKLVKLSAGISKILFGGSKLEVTEIREEEGKDIAYINLINAADWEPKFQGSTGGGINSESLVLTYLQKDYTNSWIDGVHFTMDGKDILLDHAPILEDTQYRKN